MESGQQIYVVQSQNRKTQPKQAKNFSPIKTALILDHYQNIEASIQSKNPERRVASYNNLPNRTLQQP
jgi:hypothetical protein